MDRIQNAAPMTIMQGIEDKSTRQVTPEAENLPQHLPVTFLFTKKGPDDGLPQFVVGNSRNVMFGDESFDPRSKFATHQTALSNILNAAANTQAIFRLKPTDAPAPASIRLSLDLLSSMVDEYQRNEDNSLKLDETGAPIKTGNKIPGFKGKWVVGQVGVDQDGNSDFGLAGKKAGNQINTDNNTQSVRIPFMDVQVPHFGSDGNNCGIRIWAPTSKSNIAMDPTLLEDNAVYPIRMACMYRETDTSTPKIVSTLYGENYIDTCLKPNTLNRRIDSLAYIGDNFIQAYQDLENPVNPPFFGPFGRVHVYDDFVAETLTELYNAEVPYMDSNSDFLQVEGEEFRLNVFGGVDSKNNPYHSFVLQSTDNDSVRLSENSTIFAQGGGDGTMDDEMFNKLTRELVSEFANPLSPLLNDAKYPVSIIYDSGFQLDTKYALCDFIAIRKDTAVVLATHTVGEPMLKASEDSSLALALKTRLQNYPESDYFGTPVTRGMIIGRSGKLLNSQFTMRLPLTLEVAAKAAGYMGAGNGIWKSGKNFDHWPDSLVTMFGEISETFTPATVRNKDWKNGLNWVQSFGRRSNFFPALKTVYEDDTSVLNSFTTMLACCELQKVGAFVWRKWSGVDSLTNAQLSERVVKDVMDMTNGRFDDRYVIVPEVYFTNADKQRGYSWSLRIKIYAPNMKTVMTLSVQALRLEDLAA